MNNIDDLKNALILLGVFEKAKEIHSKLGEKAVLSYIKSSHRLLNKVYHPDFNSHQNQNERIMQKRLDQIDQMNDEEIIELFKIDAQNENNQKTKLLVVEDEFGLQEIFRATFMMEGYEVRVASDGESAYDTYLQFHPDLIFTDVVMPKMGGLELVRKIRKTEKNIKVVFVSGFFGIKRIRNQLDEDIKKYGYPSLAKPFKTSEMLVLVKEYLAK